MRDMRHPGFFSPWRNRYCGIIVVLIASIPVWLSPISLFVSVVTHSPAEHHAKPPRRGIGGPDSFQVPSWHVQIFGEHTAAEPEDRLESRAQSEARIVGMLPLPQTPHHPRIPRLGAVSIEARLAILQPRDLPLIC